MLIDLVADAAITLEFAERAIDAPTHKDNPDHLEAGLLIAAHEPARFNDHGGSR